jgi:AcrR family transcriptional regulator
MKRPSTNADAHPSSTVAPRGRPRSAKAEDAILQAALEILDQLGYGAFSIEAVAARAGVGRPTIYRRWASKLELAVEVVVRLAPPLQVNHSDDPLADLRHLVSTLLPDLTSSATGRAIIALASDPEVHGELAQRLDERYLQPRRAVLAELLQRATDAGQIRPDVDPQMLIDLILGAASYRWLTTGIPASRESALRIVDAVITLCKPSG